jgi:ribosomal protein L13E
MEEQERHRVNKCLKKGRGHIVNECTEAGMPKTAGAYFK